MHISRLLRSFEFFAASLLMTILFCSANSFAGDGFQPVSADELKMTSEPLAPGAAAIILYREVNRDDSAYPGYEYNYVRIKILTEEGRKYADVEIPFFKEEEEDVVKIKGRTIHPDGSIVNFEGKAFDKTLVKARGVRYLAKTFTLPAVQPGSVIEYYYTKYFGRILYNAHWILSEELFTKRARFSMKPYDHDPTLGVQWSWQRLPPGTGEPKRTSNDIVRLEVANIPAFHTEDFMPPPNELKARVDFIYTSNRFDTKEADKFWKEVGKYDDDYLENYIVKHKGLGEVVAQVVGPGDSPETKLQKLYARVQALRNTTYENQRTEEEYKRENDKHSGSVMDVLQRGYGSLRQLNLLYLSLVWAAGFEAYPVDVPPRNNYFFYPSVMDFYRLTENLVLVKLDGKDIFCDPGSLYSPFGLPPWRVTGVPGLKLDKSGGTWIQIPLSPGSASRIERTANLKLSDSGDLEGKLKVKYTGYEAVARRVEERNEDDTARQKFLEEQVRNSIPVGIEVELANHPDWTTSESPLTAEFNLKIPGWASSAGSRALLSVGLFGGGEKRIFEHSERIHPIYFEFPFQRIDDVTIELLAGWKVTSLPSPQNQVGKVIGYTMKAENDGSKVHVQRTLDIGVLMVGKENYEILQNFFQMVRSSDEAQIVLQPGTATASK